MKPSEIPVGQRRLHRMSSDEWVTANDKSLAEIVNDEKQFRAKIHLNQFESFEENEIDVRLHNYDVSIYAAKENPQNPNRPSRTLNRMYRLPDDLDVRTIRLERSKSEVDVKANKIPKQGAPLMLDILDVTKVARNVQRMRAF
ncbi:SHSP domain-containing protein [Aphelenchoides fujianensis]|nr:SHSP domain-containing protein [Aphelenchoides fujianensis]